MEITRCPPNLVPDAVRCIGYRGELAEPLVRRLAPSGGVKLIFRFGDPLRSASGTRQAVPVTAAAVVVGIKDGPGTTAHAGVVDSIQVRLTPLGAYRMLGVPMADLRGSAVDLADCPGRTSPPSAATTTMPTSVRTSGRCPASRPRRPCPHLS